MEKTVRFTHLGKTYEMTEDQIEAAFRYQERQYRRMDAESQLDEFIYGDNPGNLMRIDLEIQEKDFKERYEMEVADAYKLLDEIIDQFDKMFTCEIGENTIWQEAIRAVLTGE